MKVTTMLVSAMLVLGLTGVAHAVNMFAGPLGGASCSCLIVNVSPSTRTVQAQLLNKGGLEIVGTGPVSLDSGEANGISGAGSTAVYCKFTSASPNYFRATMTCDGASVPAR